MCVGLAQVLSECVSRSRSHVLYTSKSTCFQRVCPYVVTIALNDQVLMACMYRSNMHRQHNGGGGGFCAPHARTPIKVYRGPDVTPHLSPSLTPISGCPGRRRVDVFAGLPEHQGACVYVCVYYMWLCAHVCVCVLSPILLTRPLSSFVTHTPHPPSFLLFTHTPHPHPFLLFTHTPHPHPGFPPRQPHGPAARGQGACYGWTMHVSPIYILSHPCPPPSSPPW